MRDHRTIVIIACAMLILGVALNACQRARTPATPASSATPSFTPSEAATASSTSTLTPYPPTNTPVFVTITPLYPPPANIPTGYPPPGSQATALPTNLAYPQPPAQAVTPTTQVISPAPTTPLSAVTQQQAQTPLATATPPTPSPAATKTVVSQYPGPGVPTSYPGPFYTHTIPPYRGSPTSTPQPTKTLAVTATPAVTRSGTPPTPVFPTPTRITGTPGVIPTELPPKPPVSPPPPGSSVTIWHSWSSAEAAELQSIIQAFQKIYPDVTISLQYVPLDDLYSTYEEAAYLGEGPSLLLGPAKWGPALFDEELIADLSPYFPANYLTTINPAALASGNYNQYLISLPLSQQGMVMFRNTLIVKTAPVTFDELETYALDVTHGGLVGSYLERGALFSSADIIGLGGMLMDESGYPAFNDEFGLQWFELLADYDTAGAVTFNTNWDLEMFKRGRVGIIIDGTWNISTFSQVLGAENIAIDPWPEYGTGHLSGWVEADSVFLNANITGDNRFAALSFMGYLLDPNVQVRLAEVGHIPSVITAEPRDPLIHQAMDAFSYGSAYPIAIDDEVIDLYQRELDAAIYSVFNEGVPPAEALQTASDNITTELNTMKAQP